MPGRAQRDKSPDIQYWAARHVPGGASEESGSDGDRPLPPPLRPAARSLALRRTHRPVRRQWDSPPRPRAPRRSSPRPALHSSRAAPSQAPQRQPRQSQSPRRPTDPHWRRADGAPDGGRRRQFRHTGGVQPPGRPRAGSLRRRMGTQRAPSHQRRRSRSRSRPRSHTSANAEGRRRPETPRTAPSPGRRRPSSSSSYSSASGGSPGGGGGRVSRARGVWRAAEAAEGDLVEPAEAVEQLLGRWAASSSPTPRAAARTPPPEVSGGSSPDRLVPTVREALQILDGPEAGGLPSFDIIVNDEDDGHWDWTPMAPPTVPASSQIPRPPSPTQSLQGEPRPAAPALPSPAAEPTEPPSDPVKEATTQHSGRSQTPSPPEPTPTAGPEPNPGERPGPPADAMASPPPVEPAFSALAEHPVTATLAQPPEQPTRLTETQLSTADQPSSSTSLGPTLAQVQSSGPASAASPAAADSPKRRRPPPWWEVALGGIERSPSPPPPQHMDRRWPRPPEPPQNAAAAPAPHRVRKVSSAQSHGGVQRRQRTATPQRRRTTERPPPPKRPPPRGRSPSPPPPPQPGPRTFPLPAELDFFSPAFDPAKALATPGLQPPVPNIRPLDHVFQCRALLPPGVEGCLSAAERQERRKTQETRPQREEYVLKKRAWYRALGEQEADRIATTTFDMAGKLEAEFSHGPFSLLLESVRRGRRCTVYLRGRPGGVGARYDGVLEGFDRHFNLLLSGATERSFGRLKRAREVSVTDEGILAEGPDVGNSAPLAKRRRCAPAYEERERWVGNVYVQGSRVILVGHPPSPALLPLPAPPGLSVRRLLHPLPAVSDGDGAGPGPTTNSPACRDPSPARHDPSLARRDPSPARHGPPTDTDPSPAHPHREGRDGPNHA